VPGDFNIGVVLLDAGPCPEPRIQPERRPDPIEIRPQAGIPQPVEGWIRLFSPVSTWPLARIVRRF
jgi:hypothetical protein